MEKGKDLNFQGKHYAFLEQQVRELPNGKRVQITDYEVKNADGTYSYPAFVCEIPEGYEFLDLSSLSKDCLAKFAHGVVKITEGDLRK